MSVRPCYSTMMLCTPNDVPSIVLFMWSKYIDINEKTKTKKWHGWWSYINVAVALSTCFNHVLFNL